MFSLRMALLLAAVAAGMLYLAYLNPGAAHFKVSKDLGWDAPLMAPVIAAFFLGAICVPILYSLESVGAFFASIKKSSQAKRRNKAMTLYELGVERLLAGARGEAEKFFAKSLSLNPGHSLALLALGRLKRENGDVAGAVELHSKARGLNEKSVAALLELAEDYYKAERFSHAVTCLTQARALASDSLPAMERIRDVYSRVGAFKEAAAVQRSVLDNLPMAREPEGRRDLCALLFEESMESLRAGRLNEAVEGMKEALRYDGQSIPAYLKLAEIYERQGYPKSVRKTLEWSYKATHSVIPLKALELYVRAKGEGRAADIYRWAVGLYPEDEAVRMLYAGACLEEGSLDQAQEELERVKGPLASSSLRLLMEARIRRAKNGNAPLGDMLDKAYDRRMDEFFRFVCQACGAAAGEYSARCPKCGGWNKLNALLR